MNIIPNKHFSKIGQPIGQPIEQLPCPIFFSKILLIGFSLAFFVQPDGFPIETFYGKKLNRQLLNQGQAIYLAALNRKVNWTDKHIFFITEFYSVVVSQVCPIEYIKDQPIVQASDQTVGLLIILPNVAFQLSTQKSTLLNNILDNYRGIAFAMFAKQCITN